ncbi:MAG: LPS-assembly protein LptD [Gammaproteobacteria bacterium]|nr:LPS-assembly protein LptD [Gammaproteobacteria bacterium]MBU1722635.1 LPS-assembly protein LptD [Gammaproteobacteria bacterium]MBU2006682.1 LPS-assembly protein LptD [Gammaproteobacteria bacterium]
MGNSPPKTLITLSVLCLYCSPAVVFAQTEWMACPVPEAYLDATKRPTELPPQAVYIEADEALFRDQGISEMSGNVHISQQNKKFRADQATYDQDSSHVTGSGNVHFSTDSMQVSSSRLNYNLQKESGEIQDARYHLNKADGRGSSKLLVQENPNHTRMEAATYTTCPADDADWSINSPNINLYHELERGTASNVTFRIRNMPVLYLPYMSFPLTDARKSGFLWPDIGSSEKSGLQISTPYYFNLAPNYDLTLTPTLLSRRGLQLGTEFRYLSNKHNGALNYVLLPDDKVSGIDNRYYFDVNNATIIDSHSRLTLKAEGVSDDQYFVDLGNSLEATSEVNLERRLQYSTSGNAWNFSALLQDFQVLAGGSNAPSRLPQLNYNYRYPSEIADISINSEYTHFTSAPTSSATHRTDLLLNMKKRMSNVAAFFEPSLNLRHTEYQLDSASTSHISRTLPTASLDTGLFFERNIQQGKFLQTLEPRLFYTYTPYEDQSNIPVFDTSQTTFNYNQLFSTNRFTGKDRIEDANRLSVSLTSRLQNQDNGREVFLASIGQIYHFDDRKVTLPGGTTQTGKRSELVLETRGQFNPRTSLASTTFWDSETKEISVNQIDLRYKDEKKRIANIGYTKRQGDFESANVSFSAPVKDRWRAVGRLERDLLNDRNLETVIGAEYESCCWKTRIANRQYLLPDNTSRENAIFIEFELKGLGNFGSGTRDLLKERIYGYE